MNENAIVPFAYSDIERMGTAIAKSGLFGLKTAEQAIALMLLANAEGKHPAIVARDYDIIQGKPAKKSEAMLRDFLAGGGKVEWHSMTDALADATFSHPAGGTIRISWDMDRAKKAELGGKDMWRKYPRQMLRARVISEGVRAVGPFATSGLYVPEEVKDFEAPKAGGVTVDVEPQQIQATTVDPRGDLGKDVPVDEALKAADRMRAVLEADVEEDIKALHCADLSDELNKNQSLYVAAADQMSSKERNAWKSYVRKAHEISMREHTVNGR